MGDPFGVPIFNILVARYADVRTSEQYYIGLLSISFIVTAPYMSLPRWQENYLPPLQHKKINPVW